MNLKTCTRCRKVLFPGAARCGHCGKHLRRKNGSKSWQVVSVLGFIVLVLAIAAMLMAGVWDEIPTQATLEAHTPATE